MKTVRSLLLTFVLCILGWEVVFAQSDELTLFVTKKFGYNSGSDIKGTFNLEVQSPQNLTSVTFLVDGLALATVEAPPFKTDLITTEYAYGWHELSARGESADGVSLVSRTRRFNFVTSQEEMASVQRVMLPLGGFIGVIVLIMLVAQAITFSPRNRKRIPLGAPRSFGFLGGAICPKCQRPFGMHLWALNLSITGRLDRCEHCGRWSLVHRASQMELEWAIRTEQASAQLKPFQPASNPEDDLRQQLDDSKYMD